MRLIVMFMIIYTVVVLKPFIAYILDLWSRDFFLHYYLSDRKSLINMISCTKTNRTVLFKL
jgi:hypothetical protein